MRTFIPKILAGISIFQGTLAADIIENCFWYRGDACEPACIDESPCVQNNDCAGRFTVGGDWLYWKIEQEQMEIGANVTISDVDGTATITSDVIRPKFKYSSGYRVFADYTLPASEWKITAAYTHAPTSASVSATEDPVGIPMDFISLFSVNFPLLNAISQVMFDSASASWNAQMNYLDLDIARTFQPHERFEVTPHLGLRGLWSHQKFVIEGIGTDANIAFLSNLKGKTDGLGVEGGLWGTLKVADGFSIVGHFGGSVMYTKFKNSGSLDGNQDDTLLHIEYSDNLYKNIAMVDSFVGLRYMTQFSEFGVSVHVGWEQHILFDLNQFSITGDGNLTMQGLTLGAGLSF